MNATGSSETSVVSGKGISTDKVPAAVWGSKDPSGLRMRCWPDNAEKSVSCLIRNHGSQPVAVSNYFLGDLSALTLRARPPRQKTWRTFRYPFSPLSAGAGASNIRHIGPGEDVMKRVSRRPSSSRKDVSFSFKLSAYVWPPEWTGKIELVVHHRLGQDGSEGAWRGTVVSAPIICDLPVP